MGFSTCLVFFVAFFGLFIGQGKQIVPSQTIQKSKGSSSDTKNTNLLSRAKSTNRGMPKLYFRHGAVSSAKSMNLLAVAHSYKAQGKNVMLMKPALDDRFGKEKIRSRAGLEQDADVLISSSTNLLELEPNDCHCILVDESQFLAPSHIEQLRTITDLWRVPVICYGLRTDFRTHLFPGSKRLMELADSVEEIKTTCFFCNRKAVFNLKHVDGVADVDGPAVQLGSEEKYFPACYVCYSSALTDVGLKFPSATPAVTADSCDKTSTPSGKVPKAMSSPQSVSSVLETNE